MPINLRDRVPEADESYACFEADIHLWKKDGSPTNPVMLHLPISVLEEQLPIPSAIVFRPCKGRRAGMINDLWKVSIYWESQSMRKMWLGAIATLAVICLVMISYVRLFHTRVPNTFQEEIISVNSETKLYGWVKASINRRLPSSGSNI